MKEKTYVEDVNRSIYDIRNEEKDVYLSLIHISEPTRRS